MTEPIRYNPKPCEHCNIEFQPRSGNVRRCDACRKIPKPPKARPCRSCGDTFQPVGKRTKYCPACRYDQQGMGPRKTCANCQHGYEYQPGAWGCAINAARLCKPELWARQWMRREVTKGRTA